MRPSLTPNVRIEYVDGRTIEATADKWPILPAEGVWSVTWSNKEGESLIHSGHSLYWCYREHGRSCYIVGEGTVANVYGMLLPPETLLYLDGHQESRPVKFMPDLRHDQIKLGWWR